MLDMSTYGFHYVGSCHCDGYYTEKYKNGDYLLKLRSGRFKITKDGITVHKWDQLINIVSTIAEIHNNNVAIQKA